MTSHEMEPHQSSVETGDKEGTYEQKKVAPTNGNQTVILVNSQKNTSTKQKTKDTGKKKTIKIEVEKIIFAN